MIFVMLLSIFDDANMGDESETKSANEWFFSGSDIKELLIACNVRNTMLTLTVVLLQIDWLARTAIQPRWNTQEIYDCPYHDCDA